MIFNPIIVKKFETTASTAIISVSNLDEWNAFVTACSIISSNVRVELMADIDCGGATYNALTFAGDFNGNNHIISNATFSAAGDNSGMFASIGPGQIIANLVLNGITVESGTNAGVLAGTIEGEENSRALIQNVQVWGGSTSGTTNAGGIAGSISFADVKYCGIYNTTIRVTYADGYAGGIAGISSGFITQCYSVSNPTALLSS
ncbi:MAG: hypothetical protein ACI4TK_19425, partial [Agathobacter sp.]